VFVCLDWVGAFGVLAVGRDEHRVGGDGSKRVLIALLGDCAWVSTAMSLLQCLEKLPTQQLDLAM